jgi:lactate racemase
MQFLLPYDKKRIPVEIDDRSFAGALVSKVESYKPGLSQQELVEASLDYTIGSPKLEELVKGKKNIVIISSDHTRPVPSKIITPILLRRIRSAQPDGEHKDSGGNRLSSPVHAPGVDRQIRVGDCGP